MGFIEDAKETGQAAAKKVERVVEDTVDRVKDKSAELTADAKVRQAEAERDSVSRRNEAKEKLRGD
jgi:hypothetical protein